MLRVVARYADWWNLVGAPPESYAHKISVLERHCADVDRDPAEIERRWADDPIARAATRLPANFCAEAEIRLNNEIDAIVAELIAS